MERKTNPRFALVDVKNLGRVHENLTGAIMALNESKWSGSIPMIVTLQQADRLVCELYNKGEKGFTAAQLGGDAIPMGQRIAAARPESNQNG
jgi:hypothetical protein